MKKLIIIGTAALLVVAGCGGEEAAGPSDEPEEPDEMMETRGTETDEDASTRCLPVSKALRRAIATGLTVTGGGKLGEAAAVRSEDFEKVYYVSAVILGSGLEGGETVGTWATNSLRPGGGLIMAADSIAREFSDWGEAAKEGSPAAEVRGLENDGAQESRDCLDENPSRDHLSQAATDGSRLVILARGLRARSDPCRRAPHLSLRSRAVRV
jgi:hypothetical protein